MTTTLTTTTIPIAQYVHPLSFHYITLHDYTSIKEALQYVYMARNKLPNSHDDELSNPSASAVRNNTNNSNKVDKASLETLIQSFQQKGAYNVNDLRCFSDAEWRAMNDVPAIARIYLKHLVRQAIRGAPKIPSTAAIATYTNNISTANGTNLLSSSPSSSYFENVSSSLAALSINTAAVRSSNATSSAFEKYLLTLKSEYGLAVPFDPSRYSEIIHALIGMGFRREEAVEAIIVTAGQSFQAAAAFLLIDKDARETKKQMAIEQIRRAKGVLSPSIASPASSNPAYMNRLFYREFLRGLMLDERLSISSIEQLKSYRERMHLNEKDHIEVLQELGSSELKFEQMKKFDNNKKNENECVICLDRIKDHLIQPCLHLCFCEDCAQDIQSSANPKCPICDQKINAILKIYL